MNWSQNQRRLAIRVLAGAWAVLLLFFLFRLGSAISGQYTMNWSQELAILWPLVITSGGALAVLTSPPPPVVVQPLKNPGLAAVLSFFVCGLGQIYNGQIWKGLLFLLILGASVPLAAFGIGWVTGGLMWLAGIIDAYVTAKRMNP